MSTGSSNSPPASGGAPDGVRSGAADGTTGSTASSGAGRGRRGTGTGRSSDMGSLLLAFKHSCTNLGVALGNTAGVLVALVVAPPRQPRPTLLDDDEQWYGTEDSIVPV